MTFIQYKGEKHVLLGITESLEQYTDSDQYYTETLMTLAKLSGQIIIVDTTECRWLETEGFSANSSTKPK